MHPDVDKFAINSWKIFHKPLKNRNYFEDVRSHSGTQFTKPGTKIYKSFMFLHTLFSEAHT